MKCLFKPSNTRVSFNKSQLFFATGFISCVVSAYANLTQLKIMYIRYAYILKCAVAYFLLP